MAKKTFKEAMNPAMQFISKPEGTDPEQEVPQPPPGIAAHVSRPGNPPPGMRLDPRYIETKSKRSILLLEPSVHEKIKRIAYGEGISMNAFIHAAIQEKLAAYDNKD